MNNILLITFDKYRRLIQFNIDTFEWSWTNQKGSHLSNGYSDIYQLKDGSEKLVFIASFNSKLYFFYENLFDISDTSLTADLKCGLFTSHFILRKNSNILVDIKYRSVEIDADIFFDFVELLSMKNNERKKKRINRLIRFYNEHDSQKRMDIGRE